MILDKLNKLSLPVTILIANYCNLTTKIYIKLNIKIYEEKIFENYRNN